MHGQRGCSACPSALWRPYPHRSGAGRNAAGVRVSSLLPGAAQFPHQRYRGSGGCPPQLSPRGGEEASRSRQPGEKRWKTRRRRTGGPSGAQRRASSRTSRRLCHTRGARGSSASLATGCPLFSARASLRGRRGTAALAVRCRGPPGVPRAPPRPATPVRGRLEGTSPRSTSAPVSGSPVCGGAAGAKGFGAHGAFGLKRCFIGHHRSPSGVVLGWLPPAVAGVTFFFFSSFA